MAVPAEGDRVHALYGKACLNCVRSKTRCALPSTGGKCERCLRLNKDCQPAPTVRKKRASNRPVSSMATVANKTAALEEKLDDIVQLLQRSQDPQSQPASSISIRGINQLQDQIQHGSSGSVTFNNVVAPSNDPRNLLSAAQNCTNYNVAQESHMPATSYGSTPADTLPISCSANASSPSAVNYYPLESEAECEECLETYRTKMVAFFPIVVIRPEVTVAELREQRPFLWLVIRAICSKNAARHRGLELEVRKMLGREMLLKGSKTLDLLLGILVYAGWGHFYIYKNPIITTDIQLGIALAADLGLTKPVPSEPCGVMLNYSAQGCPKPQSSLTNPVRTMEERRAVIGLFLVSSISANYRQRTEPMRWTSYLEECLRLLEEKKDYSTDQFLVYLTRVQLIRNQAATVVWTDTLPTGNASDGLPKDFYVHTFKSQIEELKRSVPSELKSNATLQLHILETVISIHEHSLTASPSKDVSFDSSAHLRRAESLWACLTATKSWFNTFFSLDLFPLSCYAQVTMAIFTQMAHCLVTLFRLSTFESAGVYWDRQRVRQELDFAEVLKTWLKRWRGALDATGLDIRLNEDEASTWGFSNKILSGILNWWEVRIAPRLANKSENEGMEGSMPMNTSTISNQQQVETIDLASMNLDFSDDVWMMDVLGGYEHFGELYM
ncbi:hypothetical protein K469DRAFT_564540 [Zopfia rhizophila CBS 207.26]|uniref:Zn(2)-C6 fungal-type domain-containing protein n=1 Tax=Zopfia rhizophila CBS 207.26 TaxID=1314779 RepID=A0A6A6EAG9_9PEZI|nr:hypothetical protein K469DRAFT_564540 [Zopfia rhizophila CBS 207.26]